MSSVATEGVGEALIGRVLVLSSEGSEDAWSTLPALGTGIELNLSRWKKKKKLVSVSRTNSNSADRFYLQLHSRNLARVMPKIVEKMQSLLQALPGLAGSRHLTYSLYKEHVHSVVTSLVYRPVLAIRSSE